MTVEMMCDDAMGNGFNGGMFWSWCNVDSVIIYCFSFARLVKTLSFCDLI